MAITDTYGKIASLLPADTVEYQLVVAPAGTTYIGTLRVVNKTSAAVTCNVAHCSAAHGDVAANADDYIFYGTSIAANQPAEIPLSIGPTETIRVASTIASSISYHFSGCIRVVS